MNAPYKGQEFLRQVEGLSTVAKLRATSNEKTVKLYTSAIAYIDTLRRAGVTVPDVIMKWFDDLKFVMAEKEAAADREKKIREQRQDDPPPPPPEDVPVDDQIPGEVRNKNSILDMGNDYLSQQQEAKIELAEIKASADQKKNTMITAGVIVVIIVVSIIYFTTNK